MDNLIIPINVQALCIGKKKDIDKDYFLETEADFSTLPFQSGPNQFTNEGNAFISDTVLTLPFQNNAISLSYGVHLQWTLPKALTHGTIKDEEIRFPKVPDCWLITRICVDKTTQKVLSFKSWILESSYLSSDNYDGDIRKNNTTIFYDSNLPPSYQPYRYLGKMFPYESWKAGTGAEYWKKLSAIGFGNASFAAYYPDSRTVFGFNDKADDVDDPLNSLLSYCVSGWFADSADDPLKGIVLKNNQTLQQALLEKYDWSIDQNISLGATLFSGTVVNVAWKPEEEYLESPNDLTDVDVAVGLTDGETLSALIADRCDENAQTVEHLLNALLSGHLDDLNATQGNLMLSRALFEKRFQVHHGGLLWQINSAQEAKIHRKKYVFPTGLASLLNELNAEQLSYNRCLLEIQSQRWQIFVDWYKYLLQKYSADKVKGLTIEQIKCLINTEIAYLKTKETDLQNSKSTINKHITTIKKKLDSCSFRVNEFENLSTAQKLISAICEKTEKTPETYSTIQDAVNWLNSSVVPYQLLKDHLATDESGAGVSKLIKKIVKHFKVQAFSDLTQEQLTTLAKSANGQKLKRLTLEFLFPENMPQWVQYNLNNNVASRYYEGNEPIIMLNPNPKSNEKKWSYAGYRNQTVGDSLDCRVSSEILTAKATLPKLEDNDNLIYWKDLNALMQEAALISQYPSGGIDQEKTSGESPAQLAVTQWNGTPWLPIKVEWKASYLPLEKSSNDGADFDSDFIASHFNSWEFVQSEFQNSKFSVSDLIDAISKSAGKSSQVLSTATEGLKWLNNSVEPFQILIAYIKSDEVAVHGGLAEGVSELTKRISTSYSVSSFIDLSPDQLTDLAKTVEGQQLKRLILDNWFSDKTPRTHIFYWDEDGMELDYLKGKFSALSTTLTGSSLLTPHAKVNMIDQITTYLKSHNVEGLDAIKSKIENMTILSQNMGGMNKNLVMRKEVLQLPIADPVGGTADADFVTTVKNAVDDMNRTTPLPESQFSPICCGLFKIIELRLVDAFGRFKNVDLSNVIYSRSMKRKEYPTLETQSYKAFLPLRISQPSRLLFSFLSAARQEAEMNSFPETNPICGWILPNFLDDSLMIYQSDGTPLGSLKVNFDKSAVLWRNAPRGGTSFNATIDDALSNSNVQLKNFCLATKKNGGEYLYDFIQCMDRALSFIEPADFRQDKGTLVLMGRPLALVQASLEFDLFGNPQVNESWSALINDIKANIKNDGSKKPIRSDADFATVDFPVKIGEHTDFEDGSVGFFKGNDNLSDFQTFYSDAAEQNKNANLINNTEVFLNLEKASKPQNITLLMDPRCSVNSITGILPVKPIKLPPFQYSEQLKNIGITFFTSPILIDPENRTLPIPKENGWSWSWVERKNTQWSDIPIKNSSGSNILNYPKLRIADGWLKLSRNKND